MAPTSFDAGRVGHWKSSRLPKSRRLNRQRLIQPLFDRGNPDTRTISYGHIRLLYRFVQVCDAGSAQPLQVGFAVSKSIGKAVLRNRTKRRLRETFRRLQPGLVEQCAGEETVLTLMIVVRRLPNDEETLSVDLIEALRRLIDSLSGGEVASQYRQPVRV